jgi:predicted ATP-binding protein involved in virulence
VDDRPLHLPHKVEKKALERAHKKKETKEKQSGRDNTLEGKNNFSEEFLRAYNHKVQQHEKK